MTSKSKRCLDYAGAHRKQNADEAYSEKRAVSVEIGIMSDHVLSADHIRWLEGLAKLPYVVLDLRRAARVQRSLEWLRGKRGRILLPAYVAAFEKYETGQRLRNEGVAERPMWTDAERDAYIAKKKTANTLLRLRREETKPRNAAFLDDPSLLPKRPPGRTA